MAKQSTSQKIIESLYKRKARPAEAKKLAKELQKYTRELNKATYEYVRHKVIRRIATGADFLTPVENNYAYRNAYDVATKGVTINTRKRVYNPEGTKYTYVKTSKKVYGLRALRASTKKVSTSSNRKAALYKKNYLKAFSRVAESAQSAEDLKMCREALNFMRSLTSEQIQFLSDNDRLPQIAYLYIEDPEEFIAIAVNNVLIAKNFLNTVKKNVSKEDKDLIESMTRNELKLIQQRAEEKLKAKKAKKAQNGKTKG